MDFLKRLFQKRESDRFDATSTYRQMLTKAARAGDLKGRDAELCEAAMAELQLTVEDFEADIRTLHRVAQLEPLVTKLESRKAEHLDAKRELAKAQSALEQVIRESQGKIETALKNQNSKAVAHQHAIDSSAELLRLKSTNPRLFDMQSGS